MARPSKQKSFRNQIHMILLTLGIAPYGLAIYLFSQTDMTVTETVMLIAVVALLFHLLGFHMLRRFSDQLILLLKRTERSLKTRQTQPEEAGEYSVVELNTLTSHFRMLLNELEDHKRQQSELTINLMKCARRDIERYQKQLADSKALHPFVNNSVLEQISQQGAKGTLANQKRLVTVLFADIRGFTSLSEHLAPDEMVPMLNEYFDTMVKVIHTHHGVVDKFIGDAIMAVFGLTQPKDRSTLDAVRAALAMREAVQELMQRREAQGMPVFSIGIGLNTGEVVAGTIGSENRKDYTVIGDTVNVASRLESLAKNNQIVASEDTRRRCQSHFSMQQLGRVQLKNRKEPVSCYLVLDTAAGSVPVESSAAAA
ncbi:MAG TPA: adenylate/guanylate cyclase domain-containing protein [Mariprofundaceae bacterium]|nr:adenylate/guanylate cyclase domain-containing protein [Mariprofundaceae bacterium]